jgi:hypothetical protein
VVEKTGSVKMGREEEDTFLNATAPTGKTVELFPRRDFETVVL